MSFWGIEVRPGKPVTHRFDRTRGRLRISQATLGIGSARTKSLVQCNVGNKTPLFLCALLPEKTESCHLDLEFEEDGEVVFSVLGPRSAHLTGYYVSKSSYTHLGGSDTESFGEDIAFSDTEVSNQCSDEDEYEDSFIDDGEPEVLLSTPVSSDGDVPGKKKGKLKRLRKKHHVVESEEENTSEDEVTAKKISSPSVEKSGKVTRAENGGRSKDDKVENVDNTDAEPAKNEKPSKKRKKNTDDAKECLEVPKETESLAQERSEDGPKLKKRNKGSKGDKLNEFKDSSPADAHNKAKQHVEGSNTGKNLPETTEANTLQTSAQSIDADCVILDGDHSAKKREKKKKKKSKNVDEGANNTDLPGDEMVVIDLDTGTKVESGGMRTLSNGLTIEDLAMGEADAKVATPGRKVKVYYTGTLKENGQVIDTNVGDTPRKFRLGDKHIIEGWNIGLEGMRVGGKRRLVIPPSLGYGSQEGGENIPPNSWLIYEIELVGVRK
ncbi:unnamed protein product [Cuscuta campestris]|uniref:peptidylprolyl isomerase n=1 Tax=Cuscuta campestris TaxID=132261 RepID=A0A484LGT4_9ASTE|nr:unnamed protein product [Cuscuta campestris]